MKSFSLLFKFAICVLVLIAGVIGQDNEAPQFVPSVLLESVINGDVSGIARAIDAGENIDLVNENGWSAALIATATGNMEMVGALIDAGIDLNNPNKEGVTPLMLAANLVSVLLSIIVC